MGTLDIKLYETGNGGDIRIVGNDIEGVSGFDNMPYMGLFGSNVTDKGDSNEQQLDWWGNSLYSIEQEKALNITERRLQEVSLNSEGRQFIENAVVSDLRFMTEFANVTVLVRVISDDVINIGIRIQRPSLLEDKLYQFIWDATLGQILGAENYFPPEEITLLTDARITEDGDSRTTETGLNRLI
jgi:hypothetical protein